MTKQDSDTLSENKDQKEALKDYWNDTYKKDISKLNWYEEKPRPSLKLIEMCNLEKDAAILNVGAGATILIDELLKLGYNNVIANDLSANALSKIQERLGENNDKVTWLVDDLTDPKELLTLGEIDLWVDRAVLHFFTEKKEQDTYFQLIKKLVKKKGFVIIAVFNFKTDDESEALPVYRFEQNMLQFKLGPEFKLIEDFNYTFKGPYGDTREYVYTLFQRI